MSQPSPTLALTRALMQRPSVTPEDAGCQALLSEHLRPLGFECEDMPFGEVMNLWARRGDRAPLVVFAGHTDVVPTGPLDAWSSPPFEPRVEGGVLYGRGAAVSKSSTATGSERIGARNTWLGASPALRW